MSGKGSKQRPTDKKKFDDNYDRIFGNKTSINSNTELNNRRNYGYTKPKHNE